MRLPSLLRVASLALLAGTGCSSGSTGPNGTGRVTLQLATRGTGTAGAPMAASTASVTLGADVLDITSVQLVARKIKLERTDGTCPVADVNAQTGENDGDSPECPNLRLGPMLLSPPVTAGAVSDFTLDLPEGSYKQLQLQIHTPTNHNGDATFLTANPGFDGVSIKVVGTFNGAPFTFTTGLTSEVEVEFDTPIVVAPAGATSITLLLDVAAWFKNSGGTALLNPLTLTQQQSQQVNQNIRGSLHAFEDENHDGHHD